MRQYSFKEFLNEGGDPSPVESIMAETRKSPGSVGYTKKRVSSMSTQWSAWCAPEDVKEGGY